jgi:cell division protein FtsB
MEKDRQAKLKELTAFLKEGLLAEDLEALLEELGGAAAEPVATSEEQPSEIKPEMDNQDSFPAEEHEQSEEVKEVVVENEELTDAGTDTLDTNGELVEEKTELEPEVKAPDPEVDPEFDGIDPIQSLEESFRSIFAILEGIEGDTDLGDVAHTDNEATEEGASSEEQPAMTNDDSHPAEEHQQAEEVKEVIVETEISDTAEKAAEEVKIAGKADELNDVNSDTLDSKGELVTQPEQVAPEAVKAELQEGIEGDTDLGDVAHTDNEATEESVPAEEQPAMTNDDSHPAEEHQQAEEVKEVIIENSKNAILKRLEAISKRLVELNSYNPPTDRGQASKEAEIEKLEAEEKDLKAQLKKLNESIEGETNLGDAAHVDNEATEESSPAEVELVIDNEDIFTPEEHAQFEEVEEVIVENKLSEYEELVILEALGEEEILQEGVKEFVGAKIISRFIGLLPNSIIERNFSKAASKLSPEEKKKVQKASFGRKEKVAILKALLNKAYSEGKAKAQIDSAAKKVLAQKKSLKESVLAAGLTVTVAGLVAIVLGSISTVYVSSVFGAAMSKWGNKRLMESVEGQTDLGDAAHVKNVATSENKPSEIQPSINNDDIFPNEEHAQTEEVKEVIVEGIEGETGLGDAAHVENKATEKGAPAEEQPQMSNDDSHPAEEHQQAEEVKEVVVEASKYSSLKEAFLLQENYFDVTGYRVVSSEEKKATLVREMALLIAKESQDPLYDQLLEATVLAKKVEKSLVQKYDTKAKEKADKVIELKKKK